MGYTVFYGGQNLKDDRAAWDSCGTDYIVRTNVEKTSFADSRRRRRYWCASPTSSNIGWKGDGTGGQACSGLGSVSALGGGQNGFTGKDQHFPGKFAGYKCAVSTPRNCTEWGTRGSGWMRMPYCKKYEDLPMGPKLKTWSGDSKMTTAGVKDNDGKFKSLWDQIVFGVKTQYDTSDGFCADAKNLSTVVHKDGRTCYEMLKGAGQQALADTKTKSYCESATGRMDEKCKCYNVTGSGFLDNCRKNPTWPGCKELIPRISELEKLLKGSNLTLAEIGNADCIVPDICGNAGIYIPSGGKPVCETKMEVCNQVMKQDNVEAYGDLKSIQSCNFSGENSLANIQKRKDEEKAAAAAAAVAAKKKDEEKAKAAAAAKKKKDEDAKKKKAADAKKSAAKKAADAKKKKAADAKKKKAADAKKKKAADAKKKKAADAKKKAPAPAPSAAPATKPGGMPQQTQIGLAVGGVIVLISCLLFLMMMMRGGGGGGGRRR
jgi:hypothetical protein